jgi:hypothetical protein
VHWSAIAVDEALRLLGRRSRTDHAVATLPQHLLDLQCGGRVVFDDEDMSSRWVFGHLLQRHGARRCGVAELGMHDPEDGRAKKGKRRLRRSAGRMQLTRSSYVTSLCLLDEKERAMRDGALLRITAA